LRVPKKRSITALSRAFARPAHAQLNAPALQQRQVSVTGVFRPLVGVMQEIGLRVTAFECHVQRLFDETGIIAGSHGPANDHARVEIEDHCQVQPPLAGGYVRDIRYPLEHSLLGR
jgi:hypothetical protein